MFIDIRAWCVLAACAGVSARDWTWPDQPRDQRSDQQRGQSVRIDTKVHFDDGQQSDKSVFTSLDITKRGSVQSDEAPFRQPTSTAGFYNRPPGAGRYPVRIVQQEINDGTLDSIQYCKCVSTPDCNPRRDSAEVCGPGKYLCCSKRPNKEQLTNNEFFNEIDDERPMLFPGKENSGGPFPPPPPGEDFGDTIGPAHGTLVGPGGPTGVVGPPQRPVLTGPDGPTGVIGPAHNSNLQSDASAQRGILVGPGGPTGIIGPYNRGLSIGSRRPSGVIRPQGGSRGVLVGPGGPTNIIGPGYGRQSGPGVLVGPGGPTGIIGPGRQLLVGPGGPTGRIGPQQYYDSETKKLSTSSRRPPEKIVENKNENNVSRVPEEGGSMHPNTPDNGTNQSISSRSIFSQSRATLQTAVAQSHVTIRRVRRRCTRGCANDSTTASPLSTIKKKGYRIKLLKKVVQRSKPVRGKPICQRPGGGCGEVAKALLPSSRRAGMGIEHYPTSPRKRTKPPKRPKIKRPHPPPYQPGLELILRNDDTSDATKTTSATTPTTKPVADKDNDFLTEMLSNMISAYLKQLNAQNKAPTTPLAPRDQYGDLIITSPLPVTRKPSMFRKIPVFLGLLKFIKSLIVFGFI